MNNIDFDLPEDKTPPSAPQLKKEDTQAYFTYLRETTTSLAQLKNCMKISDGVVQPGEDKALVFKDGITPEAEQKTLEDIKKFDAILAGKTQFMYKLLEGKRGPGVEAQSDYEIASIKLDPKALLGGFKEIMNNVEPSSTLLPAYKEKGLAYQQANMNKHFTNAMEAVKNGQGVYDKIKPAIDFELAQAEGRGADQQKR